MSFDDPEMDVVVENVDTTGPSDFGPDEALRENKNRVILGPIRSETTSADPPVARD